ncbi:unnamed protein product [Schistosoma mattheei]|uniref:Uncharacterized protein n=1 Tax=Schistosoma mattheei TaxID=31246 RepID=A0AA85BWN7_9TREM|nr:unnamed protein product [Schistosoma mattheei]
MKQISFLKLENIFNNRLNCIQSSDLCSDTIARRFIRPTNFLNNLSYVNKTFTLDNNHCVCFHLANNRSNRIRYSIETMENILSQCEDATFAGAYAKRGPEPLWVVETK